MNLADMNIPEEYRAFCIRPDDRLPPHLAFIRLPEGGSVLFHIGEARRVLSAAPEGSLISIPRPLYEAIKAGSPQTTVH